MRWRVWSDRLIVLLVLLGLSAFWYLTIPRPLTEADLPQHTADVANGKLLYTAGGCHSCHLPGPELQGVDASVPAGGTPLKTPVGIFYPPNLTPDAETGLGKWSEAQIVAAIRTGVRPDGRQLVPIMPYMSYAAMSDGDAQALAAYLKSLAPIKHAAPPMTAHAAGAPAPYLTVKMPQ